MKLAAKTDIGNSRKENQDNYRAAQFPDGTVWALVCDGMGGANGGSLASQIAAETIQGFFAHNLSNIQKGNERAFLMNALGEASRKIYDTASQNPAMSGMGTTAVCMLVTDGMAHIAHMGDSRAYLLRDQALEQITRDHSMVQEMVESGELTPQQAEHHPQKNLITRALGVDPKVMPEYTNVTVAPGDLLLLCTDGLTNMVPAEALTQAMLHTPFFELPEELVRQALAAGGQDNITVLLIGVEPTEAEQHG